MLGCPSPSPPPALPDEDNRASSCRELVWHCRFFESYWVGVKRRKEREMVVPFILLYYRTLLLDDRHTVLTVRKYDMSIVINWDRTTGIAY